MSSPTQNHRKKHNHTDHFKQS